MLSYFLVAAVAFYAAGVHLAIKRKWAKRVQVLEQDLQHFSEAMCQMAEIQMKAHRKLSANIETLEERIIDFSTPSNDANLPLERRHQVMALVRQGVSLEDIVKRLKAPRGEAELILNLSKYMGMDNPQAPKSNEQVKQHA